MYHLLKQGETEDGKVLVRILDSDGAYVKEAALKPKTIAMIDISQGIITNFFNSLPLTHQEATYMFAKRNNPFAKYDIIDATMVVLPKNDFELGRIGVNERKLSKIYNTLTKKIKAGEKIDYISVSLGNETELCNSKKTAKSKYIKKRSKQLMNFLLK